MISEVEPDLRQIIQTLRAGNLEMAKDRTGLQASSRLGWPTISTELVVGNHGGIC